jgi:hypothetical protein
LIMCGPWSSIYSRRRRTSIYSGGAPFLKHALISDDVGQRQIADLVLGGSRHVGRRNWRARAKESRKAIRSAKAEQKLKRGNLQAGRLWSSVSARETAITRAKNMLSSGDHFECDDAMNFEVA